MSPPASSAWARARAASSAAASGADDQQEAAACAQPRSEKWHHNVTKTVQLESLPLALFLNFSKVRQREPPRVEKFTKKLP